MSTSAKPTTLPALKAHCKALEDCVARANKELRQAKKDLAHRDAQLQAAQEHVAAIQEVLVTAKVLAQRATAEYWPAEPKADSTALAELLALLEEWSPAP